MANLDAPVGLWPKLGTGGSSTPAVTKYTVAAGYTTRIGQGSPVTLVASGTVQIISSTQTTVFLGVAQNHYVSNTGRYDLWVFDDPKQIFEIQADENQIDTTKIGLNFPFLNPGTVNSTTSRSATELDSSRGTTGFADHPLKLVAISRNVDKDEKLVSWTGCVVRINEASHIWAKNSGLGV